MDAKLSQGEHIGDLDELEEEFNVVPANRAQEVHLSLSLSLSLCAATTRATTQV